MRPLQQKKSRRGATRRLRIATTLGGAVAGAGARIGTLTCPHERSGRRPVPIPEGTTRKINRGLRSRICDEGRQPGPPLNRPSRPVCERADTWADDLLSRRPVGRSRPRCCASAGLLQPRERRQRGHGTVARFCAIVGRAAHTGMIGAESRIKSKGNGAHGGSMSTMRRSREGPSAASPLRLLQARPPPYKVPAQVGDRDERS